MADERLREVERAVRPDDAASLVAWTRELLRLGLACEECDACWGKGWTKRVTKEGVEFVARCGPCSRGEPQIRQESVYTLTVHGQPIAPPPGRPRRRVERNEGHWGQRARAVVSRVLTENPTLGAKELKPLLRAAYPFGQRALHPYKVWLKVVREALDTRR